MAKHFFESNFEVSVAQRVKKWIDRRIQVAKPDDRCMERRTNTCWTNGSRDKYDDIR